jgi:hypothetical protein
VDPSAGALAGGFEQFVLTMNFPSRMNWHGGKV